MAWFDEDENEQESGPAAVARALAGSEQAEPPEEVPEAQEQQNPVESTGQSQQPTASASSPADEEAYAYAGRPLEAPKSPVLKSHVAPVAQDRAAQDHAEFTQKVASGAYKPSVWRRIGGALAGGAVAFGTRNPAEGMRVADEAIGAPLNKAQREEDLRQQTFQQQMAGEKAQNEAIDQENQNAANIYNMGERNLRNQGYAANQNATAQDRWAQAQQRLHSPDANGWQPDDPGNLLGSYHAITIGGKPLKSATPPPDVQKSNDYLIAKRRVEGTAQGLTGDDLKSYTLTGKIPTKPNRTSFHMPSAESEKLHMWTAAFRKDNGRPPNAAEIAAFGHQASGAMSKNLGDKIEANKDVAFQKAQTYYATSKDAGLYQGELQAAQNEYEQRIENATGESVPHVEIAVDENGNVNWGSAQQSPAAQPQAQPAAQPAAGPADTVRVRRSDGQTGSMPRAQYLKAPQGKYTLVQGK